jgi:Sulfotransferase domain
LTRRISLNHQLRDISLVARDAVRQAERSKNFCVFRLPDFLVIGVQKGGTTWLWKMLRGHPGVRVPPQKEIHYFDRMILKESIEWYMQQVSNGARDSEVVGEKTPCYSILKRRSIRFIRELMPEVRIVLILRRPAERAWSQARMEVSKFNNRELTSKDVSRCVYQTGLIRNTRRTDYRRIVENWLSVFPREQVFIGFQDEIERDPTAILTRIFKFLGVKSDVTTVSYPPAERVWESPSMEMPPKVKWYLNRRYRRTAEWIAERFPGEAGTWREPQVKPDDCTLYEKAQMMFTGYAATLSYNVLYAAYDLVRDVRLSRRIWALRQAGNR